MVLDKPTYQLYRQIDSGQRPPVSLDHLTDMNEQAAQWCRNLRLSRLYDGEAPPPSGKVGQYGRFGCVLMESASSGSASLQDVCCFSYEPRHFGRFIPEPVSYKFVRFVHSSLSDVDVVERISGLHTVSLTRLGVELDTDLTRVERMTDVATALDWGRHHATSIATHDRAK
jgi:hypothetical protein